MACNRDIFTLLICVRYRCRVASLTNVGNQNFSLSEYEHLKCPGGGGNFSFIRTVCAVPYATNCLTSRRRNIAPPAEKSLQCVPVPEKWGRWENQYQPPHGQITTRLLVSLNWCWVYMIPVLALVSVTEFLAWFPTHRLEPWFSNYGC
jgi:hypothetical protein